MNFNLNLVVVNNVEIFFYPLFQTPIKSLPVSNAFSISLQLRHSFNFNLVQTVDSVSTKLPKAIFNVRRVYLRDVFTLEAEALFRLDLL